MFANGIWSPICGHWFWDTHYGATLFCQKLGSNYVSGTVIKRRNKRLEHDAIRVGKCRNNDRWMQCSGGCNDLGIGNELFGCANCEAGQLAAVEIQCFTGMYTYYYHQVFLFWHSLGLS